MTIENMSDDARLLLKLQKHTRRDLTARPPLDTDTVQHLGITGENLDTFVRKWINREFRRPQNLRVLVKGELKITIKWPDLKKTLSGAHP